MNAAHQTIINAIVEKAKKVCPDSLELIGVYGSVATGDVYEKSDLDLVLLIKDDGGRRLATGFLLDDSGVGYDIYCTTHEALEYDAACHHAKLSRLLDCKIVYAQSEDALAYLRALQSRARETLSSDERFARVDALIGNAKRSFADALLRDAIGDVRRAVLFELTDLADAAMLFHGRYFQKGTKRMLSELRTLPRGDAFADRIRAVTAAKTVSDLREHARLLLLFAEAQFCRPLERSAHSAALRGTYEEMFSNWRNKTEEAARRGDGFSSFMNLGGLSAMLADIGAEVDVSVPDVFADYDPDDLWGNLHLYDGALDAYLGAYEAAGIAPLRYPTADDFARAYLAD